MTASEAPRFGAQLFGFTMTPYIAAQPFRMWAVREILARLCEHDDYKIDTVSKLTQSLS